MPDGFVTQLVEDTPTVLIIAQEKTVLPLVESVVTEAGVGYHTVESNDLTESLSPYSFYKIIWLTSTTEQAQPDKNITNWLMGRSESVVILGLGVSPIESPQPEWFGWTTASLNQSSWLAFAAEQLPAAHVLLIPDVVAPERVLPLTTFFAQATLFNPLTHIHVHDHSMLAGHLARHLFHPHLPLVSVLQGHQVSTGKLLELVQDRLERYYQRQFSLVTSPVYSLSWGEHVVEFAHPPHAPNWLEIMESVVRGSVLAELAAHPPVVVTPEPKAPRQPKHSATPPSNTRVENHAHREVVSAAPAAKRVSPPVARSPVQPPSAVAVSSPTPPQPDVVLEQTIRNVFQENRTTEKLQQVTKMTSDTKHVLRKQHRRKRLFLVGLVVLGAAIGLLSLAGVYAISWNISRQALVSELETLIESQQKSKKWLINQSKWGFVLRTQAQAYTQLLESYWFVEGEKTAQIITALNQINTQLANWSAQQKTVLALLLGQPSPESSLSKLTQPVATDLFTQLSLLQANLKTLDVTIYKPAQAAQIEAAEQDIIKLRKSLLAWQQLQPLFPALLGYQGKRTYAVVLQNSQELRPTGGFLQAITLLTYDQGRLIDTQTVSVYELDAKQVGTVAPPEDLKRFLGEQRLFLRDSNWSPDFPTAAQQMSWFIEKNTSKKIDGVIALNNHVLQELLAATGPLELPEYNEVITDKNIHERLEFHSEIQFAGISDKPDYSSVLLAKLWQRLPTLSSEKVPALGSVLKQQLDQNEMMISFAQPAEQQIVAGLGWAGAMVTPDCPPQFTGVSCLVDTIAQVEANVGVNKANYYLQRKINHQVSLSPAGIQHTRSVTWRNTAQTNAWPKGSYKAYTRFYVPLEVTNIAVTINQVPLSSDQLLITEERGKRVIGVVTDTPIQAETQLVFSYTRPLPYSGSFSYLLFDQKQPGTSGTTRSLTMRSELPQRPTLLAPTATVQGSVFTFDVASKQHILAGVKFE